MNARNARRHVLKLGMSAVGAGLLGQSNILRASTPIPGNGRQMIWRNWSGIQSCQVESLLTPADEAAIAKLLHGTTNIVRCVGSGHSFTGLVPTQATILSLDKVSGLITHDKGGMTASVRAGTRLAQLSRQLDALGLALPNLPDIDAQSFAGAISTATHGTGAGLQALHAGVRSIRMVTAKGDVIDTRNAEHAGLLDPLRVSLGSLGVLTEMTTDVVPAFKLHRRVWLKPVEELLEVAPQLALEHRHFEFYYLPFTGFAAAITHDIDATGVTHHPDSADENMLRDLRRLRDWLGKSPDLRRWVARKLIDVDQTETAVDQSWKLLSTPRPMLFNESECHIPREAGIACVREVIQKLEQRNEVFFPLEFRFVKADTAWLSPFYQRDSCSIAVHAAAGEPYAYLVNEIAPIFRKYQGRPHWGKLHAHGPRDFKTLYPRWQDFLEVRQQLDPQGRLLNPYLRQLFGVPA
ncbi:MAG: FAD-binding protein [Burkholderiales bacterium]|nr:FAD-binding protein [Burkholderiales bacterium]